MSDMFKTLSKHFSIKEDDIYITPYLSSFKIYINKTINNLKYNYNIKEKIIVDDKIIYQIWVNINLLCNYFHVKLKANKKLNYSLLDNVINYIDCKNINSTVK